MEIVWDERKRRINIEKHDLDFADLNARFFDSAIVSGARVGRMRAIGPFRDGAITVIFRWLGKEAISILSMRPASNKEKTLNG